MDRYKRVTNVIESIWVLYLVITSWFHTFFSILASITVICQPIGSIASGFMTGEVWYSFLCCCPCLNHVINGAVHISQKCFLISSASVSWDKELRALNTFHMEEHETDMSCMFMTMHIFVKQNLKVETATNRTVRTKIRFDVC